MPRQTHPAPFARPSLTAPFWLWGPILATTVPLGLLLFAPLPAPY